ncbi:MAG: PilZ domain-containing protein [Candidatus Tectomicrobia bacterium]|uniref:PilZ domain-containing protein n=1 Tax=Tectimicrobiota bacterium TaxID=2528274 RepID=A0A933E716_UNCTE|nr:PilZ domain-containing protein [Candidatus Tectomicrobia bacterium]
MAKDADAAQRRSMVRMDDQLEISHRPVPDFELEGLSRQIITRSGAGGATGTVTAILQAAGRSVDPNSPTWKAISLLDQKLDFLISMAQAQMRANVEATEFYRAQVNISGSGIRFPSQQLYSKGSHLWIGMVFIGAAPSFRVDAVGRVERLSSAVKSRGEKTPSVEVGARFVAINDQDSEQILRYVFQKQREMLRARSRDA